MNKIVYWRLGTDGRVRARDAVTILGGEDPVDALAEGVVNSISTEVEILLGDKTIHLAMLLDPDHWSSDWEAVGVEDVDEFVAGLIEEDTP